MIDSDSSTSSLQSFADGTVMVQSRCLMLMVLLLLPLPRCRCPSSVVVAGRSTPTRSNRQTVKP